MAERFQRVDSISNAHVGRAFEELAVSALDATGLSVRKDFSVELGVGSRKKSHKFDLGSSSPPVLVECKSHRWTSGNNVPSAKVTVWNEAMYYFHCAPEEFRKIMFVLRDERKTGGETLASYYIRTYEHLIPEGVEIWEYDEATSNVEVVYSA